MKIVSTRQNKDGSINVTIRMKPDGACVLENGVARPITATVKPFMVNTRHHYRLGGQVDEIMAAHVITEAVPVYWCSVEQKWVEA
jgi:hypothetical protein